MTSAVVVSAGPSVAGLDIDALRADHPGALLVAVNRAWYARPAAFDVWTAGENPGRMWGSVEGGFRRTVELVREHRPRVWCPEHYRTDWEDLDVEAGGALTIEPRVLAGNVRADPGWPTAAHYNDGSLTPTLAWLFAVGMSEVDLYGADLRGEDGYGALRPASASPNLAGWYTPEWWANRWECERAALELAIREGAEHGRTVRWHRAP